MTTPNPGARGWRVSSRGVHPASGYFSNEILDRIEQHVRDGIKALPRRGLEIGGLLVYGPGNRIDEYVPVDSEHRQGPAFIPSPEDLAEIRRLASSSGRVAGFLRSQTRGEAEVRGTDEAICALIDGGDPLLVIVTATVSEPSLAHIFVQRENRWLEEAVFPLVQARAAAEPIPLQLPVRAPDPAPQDVVPVESRIWTYQEASHAAPAEMSAAVPRPARKRFRILRMIGLTILTLAVLVGLSAGGYLLYREVQPALLARLRPGVTEHLSATWRADGLAVKWDQWDEIVRRAEGGTLTIDDGGERMTIELSRLQVHTGTMFYVPHSATVRVRLDVRSGNQQSSAETVSINGQWKPAPESAAGGSAPADRRVVLEQAAETVNPVSAPAAANPATVPPRKPIEGKKFAYEAKKTVTSTATMEPPEVAARLDTGLPSAAAVGASPLASLGAASRPPVIPQPPAAPVGTPGNATDNNALASAAITFVPASAVQRVKPVVPPHVWTLVRQEVTVEILVSVNEKGQVTKAVPVNVKTPLERELAMHAMGAARQWVFSPALRNQRPLVSETNIKFNFQPMNAAR